jgi:hypothetical protein
MMEAWWHFILLRSYFFLSDGRVSPGECGLASSDGDPGTNGVISKLAAEIGIKAISTTLQAQVTLIDTGLQTGASTYAAGSRFNGFIKRSGGS